MLALKGRQDGFRLIFPKHFLHEVIEKKYSKVLKEKHSYFLDPIDFINETVQRVEILGFSNATIEQQQSSRGEQPLLNPNRTDENEFMYPSAPFSYRSEVSPIMLTDMTLNVEFRHTLGFLNYFIIFENFWYMFSRDTKTSEINDYLYIDIMDEIGSIYSRIKIMHPLINGMDMLSFDYTQPVAQSQTFKVEFKYSNFDFEFREISEKNLEE
jgi:hypothetical protein